MAHFYRISGLIVSSEIRLPGLISLDGVDRPDVTIRDMDVPDTIADIVASGPNWHRGARHFLFDIPAIGRFLLEDGARIGFRKQSGVTDDEIAIFLAGNIFGILLHQRGQIVLHASAVAVGGKAVLFCGISGAGKSTLAAALGARGYPLVTDDQAAIALDEDGVPLVCPDGRLLKLWSQSIAALALEARKVAAMRDRLEKFYVEPAAASVAAMPVGALYLLAEARTSHDIRIDAPNVVDASQLLVANAYRPLLVRRMGQRAAYFRVGAALADAAGIYSLSRPIAFGRIDETVARLEAHWAEIGLRETAAAELLG